MKRRAQPSIVAAGALAVGLGLATAARADYRITRDYFLDPPRGGTFALLDAYTFGAQASLERRFHLEEGMSMLHLRASGLASYPYGEGAFHIDARLLFLTLGTSAGYRYEWQNITFVEGEPMDRAARSRFEDDGRIATDGYAFGEARARLVIPLEWLFLVTEGAARYEHRQDHSFDWFYATVYDRGVLARGEATLFLRSPRIGAIGPTMRVLSLPGRDLEIGYGLVAGTRPGLLRDRDLVLLKAVVSPDDELFGNKYGPIHLLFVYRAEIKL